MGRRKDDPALQAAKGYPGKRKGMTDRAIKAQAERAEHEATDADPFAVPALFRKAPAYYRRATDLWKSLTETLRTSGRRRPGYRAALTRYCMWSQMYEDAAEELRRDCPKGGSTYKWTPVGGEERVGQHPAVKIMREAEPILRAIEDDFGFNPRSDSALTRVESFNRSQQPDLFARSAPAPEASSAVPAEADTGSDPLDLMNSADTRSPPTMQ
ncbi:hypothetical protein NS365_04205 [Aureimonas ureilytica]|uniref:Terminase n=1 Tax=Aureimonas ureilytica TaxID=401562 RepID=A0A175RVM9_9HYPH|nr:P27 family phage terminase small subunit [Aureimonas ureilytica]KTR07493.1 hypothetical protein NS365_04205 [Aureimonas ureilytica]